MVSQQTTNIGNYVLSLSQETGESYERIMQKLQLGKIIAERGIESIEHLAETGVIGRYNCKRLEEK